MAYEVERKFLLSEEVACQVRQGGRLLGSKHIRDVYYDAADYSLTKSALWLRCRDGGFELKARIGDGRSVTDTYEELTGPAIAKRLFDRADVPLSELLAQHAISPFADFVTQRESFNHGGCRIDVDEADFGDFQYSVAELEIVVATAEAMPQAEKQIAQIAHSLKLDCSTPVAGKLVAYLQARRTAHYQVLVSSGAVRPVS